MRAIGFRVIMGLHWDHGKYSGNYYLGLYWDYVGFKLQGFGVGPWASG